MATYTIVGGVTFLRPLRSDTDRREGLSPFVGSCKPVLGPENIARKHCQNKLALVLHNSK
jgi:hypothetical protein